MPRPLPPASSIGARTVHIQCVSMDPDSNRMTRSHQGREVTDPVLQNIPLRNLINGPQSRDSRASCPQHSPPVHAGVGTIAGALFLIPLPY